MVLSGAPADRPFWQGANAPRARALGGDLDVDVVVVGGGVAGLVAARELHLRGQRVALLEREACGSGASGKSSGFVTPDSEMPLGELIAKLGPDRARCLWELVTSGVELIASLVDTLRLDCDRARQDSMVVGLGSRGREHVESEHGARQSMGLDSRLYDARQVPLGSRRYSGAVRYGGTFGLDPSLFCRGLRDDLVARGVALHEDTAVTRVLPDGVEAGPHRVRARQVVVCCDRFIPELGALVGAIDHVQTFLAVSAPLPEATIARLFPEGPLMVWDSQIIYHYFRLVAGDRLLVGGASALHTYARHERHQPSRSLRGLARALRRTFPELQTEWTHVWPGMLGVTQDFLPVAGRDRSTPSVHYVGAATGLPWAAALGRRAAIAAATGEDAYEPELSPDRSFRFGRRAQAVLSKPVTFAAAHAIAKLKDKYG